MASTPASRLLSKEKLAGWVPHFQNLSNHVSKFNTLTASVQLLREELSTGRLLSAQIVEEYQRSICLYNEWLGAVYQLAPGALERARELDSMREKGIVLGPLHGIPILIKVCGYTSQYHCLLSRLRIISRHLLAWVWEQPVGL